MNNTKQLLKMGLRWIIVITMTQRVAVGHAAKAPVKVLDIVLTADCKSLDPAKAKNRDACHALAQVYEGLLAYHYLERPYKLAPNLAAEMPAVSSDKLVYTFKIQPGIRFQHDPCFPGGKGRELVAEDVAYTLKRIAHIQTNASGFAYIKNKIKGLDEWRASCQQGFPSEYEQNIEGIKIIDTYTIQIALHEPCPLFLSYWAMPYFYIVAKEAVVYYGHNFERHPVGTGPFVLKSGTTGKKLIFTKNPNFRLKYFPKEGAECYKALLTSSANLELPLVDKVVMHSLSKTLAWDGFKRRNIDLLPIAALSNVRKEVLALGQLKPAVAREGIGLYNEPSITGNYYIFNCEAFPFKDNPKLRQAISMAFNRQLFNKLFYYNLADSPESLIPSGMLHGCSGLFKDEVHTARSHCTNPYGSYNLQKAKAYLEEAGYPKGAGLPFITLDLPFDDSREIRQQAEFFARCMKDLGIHIQIVEQSDSVLRRKINAKATMIHTVGEHAIAYPDAISFLSLLAHPESSTFLVSDPIYPILYAHIVRMEDTAEKMVLYRRLNEMVAALAPAIWLPRPPHLVLHHNWVKNGTAYFDFGMEQYLSVDMVEKLSARKKEPIPIKNDSFVKRAVDKLKEEESKVEAGIDQAAKKIKKGVQHTKEAAKKTTKDAAEKVEKNARRVKENMDKEQ